MRILGIDLAWGERQPDGLALIQISADGVATLSETAHLTGDEALVTWVQNHVEGGPGVLALDAPIVCSNPTGAREVDRESHRVFGWAHAGCHPANSTRCTRPPRVCRRLQAIGFQTDYELQAPRQTTEPTGGPLRRQIEVFPHPAMVVLFRLPRILKYKKGPVSLRKTELARFRSFLTEELPRLEPPVLLGPSVRDLLHCDLVQLVGAARKQHEDILDAIVCAVVGLIHWFHGGRCSQVLGHRETGFIVVPQPSGRFSVVHSAMRD